MADNVISVEKWKLHLTTDFLKVSVKYVGSKSEIRSKIENFIAKV